MMFRFRWYLGYGNDEMNVAKNKTKQNKKQKENFNEVISPPCGIQWLWHSRKVHLQISHLQPYCAIVPYTVHVWWQSFTWHLQSTEHYNKQQIWTAVKSFCNTIHLIHAKGMPSEILCDIRSRTQELDATPITVNMISQPFCCFVLLNCL